MIFERTCDLIIEIIIEIDLSIGRTMATATRRFVDRLLCHGLEFTAANVTSPFAEITRDAQQEHDRQPKAAGQQDENEVPPERAVIGVLSRPVAERAVFLRNCHAIAFRIRREKRAGSRRRFRHSIRRSIPLDLWE